MDSMDIRKVLFCYTNPADEVYYCSPIYGYTEVVDQKGQHVNIGEQGEVVVTGFVEYGLPFIRYKTGDLAIYGGETELGETILTKLLGREVDCIYNKGGKRFILLALSLGDIFGPSIIYKLGNSISMKLVKWKCI